MRFTQDQRGSPNGRDFAAGNRLCTSSTKAAIVTRSTTLSSALAAGSCRSTRTRESQGRHEGCARQRQARRDEGDV
jgi:hypothetical protein